MNNQFYRMKPYVNPNFTPEAQARAQEALAAWRSKAGIPKPEELTDDDLYELAKEEERVLARAHNLEDSAFELEAEPVSEPLWVLSKRARAERKAAGLPVTKRSK